MRHLFIRRPFLLLKLLLLLLLLNLLLPSEGCEFSIVGWCGGREGGRVGRWERGREGARGEEDGGRDRGTAGGRVEWLMDQLSVLVARRFAGGGGRGRRKGRRDGRWKGKKEG